MFGAREQDWRDFAGSVQGTYQPRRLGHPRRVDARAAGHDVTLDERDLGDGAVTRIHAPILNASGFRFACAPVSLGGALSSLVGRAAFELGDRAFDTAIEVVTNNATRARAILASPKLRQLAVNARPAKIEILEDDGSRRPRFGNGVDVLQFTQRGTLTPVELSTRWALFAMLLEALSRTAPHVGGVVLSGAVVPADVPIAFQRTIDVVIGRLGAVSERVGDTFEARVPGPLGLVGGGRVVLAVPALPALVTSLHVDAELPNSSDTFRLRGRGLQAMAERGGRASRAIALLAPSRPEVDAGPDRLRVDVKELPVQQAAHVLGAALDLWQDLCRARAGLL